MLHLRAAARDVTILGIERSDRLVSVLGGAHESQRSGWTKPMTSLVPEQLEGVVAVTREGVRVRVRLVLGRRPRRGREDDFVRVLSRWVAFLVLADEPGCRFVLLGTHSGR